MSKDDNNLGITFDLPKNQSNVIKVIGVGGGGSNAINYMHKQGIKGVDFVICNTDAQALQNSGVPIKIQLGVNLTEGLGAGANPEIGEQAAIESMDDIKRMLETNTKMVFITAGMGGGTGTGAAPIIAKMAKELEILTVGIITIPFQFEGKLRTDQAQLGVERLRKHVDSLIIINNNKLREVYGNLGFKAGFSKADEVLSTASKGIAEVITHHYTQNIDLRDAKTVLSNSGTAIMGSAQATGSSRAQDAIMKALDSPLLNDNKITGAKNVLLLIVSGSKEITIDEIGEINDHIQTEAGNGANIIMGVGEDETLDESISVTIIATGFNPEQQNEISNTEEKRVVHSLEEEQIMEHNLFTKKENINTKTTETIIHNLEEEITDKNNIGLEIDLIPTSELIKNIKVIYEEVKAEISETEFIINEVQKEEQIEDTKVDKIEQTTLSFDLPLTKDQDKPKEDQITFNLNDEVKDIPVKDYIEFVAITEANEDGENLYALEDFVVKESKMNNNDSQNEELKSQEDMVFEKRIIDEDKNTSNVDEKSEALDPINTPISELLKERAEERRQKMKAFNYKFNNSKIEEIEKVPAYKRQGVNLEDVNHSSENEISRTSIDTDDSDNIKLKTNNSYLHDNVD